VLPPVPDAVKYNGVPFSISAPVKFLPYTIVELAYSENSALVTEPDTPAASTDKA